MPFIIENNNVVSFAMFQDVLDRDQRLFDANEGITDVIVEDMLIRSTQRILNKLRASDWWVQYYMSRRDAITGQAIQNAADIPAIDPNLIVARHADFTDMCVFFAMQEYILPLVADFGDEQSSERAKMSFYSNRFKDLFGELITLGDWYDWDNDGTVQASERQAGVYNLKRVR